MCRHTPIKDSAAFPRAFSIAPITSPLPSSESSCSDLHHQKRIVLIRCSTCPHVPTEVSMRIEPRALTRPTRHWVTCWHHCWRYHCHVNPNWRHLVNVISLRHTADIITGSWPLTLTFLLTIDFPLNTLILQKLLKLSFPNASKIFDLIMPLNTLNMFSKLFCIPMALFIN